MKNYPTILTKVDYVEAYYKELSKFYDSAVSPTPKECLAKEMLELMWDKNQLEEKMRNQYIYLRKENKRYCFGGIFIGIALSLLIITLIYTLA